MNISQLPKGAIPDEVDERDYQLLGAAQVDFSQEFRLPVPPDTDQGNADCCVGEAWSSYHWQLRGSRFSVHSVFAYIAQGYGASIRDGGLRIVKFGQETFTESPDPDPKTAANMRDKTGLNDKLAADDRELDSFVLPSSSIDAIAAAVKAYKGVVFGVTGSNEGWKDMAKPRAPKLGESTWGHALYVMGYHLHGTKKCLICKSSWCGVVKEHHITQDYFGSGNTFNAWTLIPRRTMIIPKRVVKKDGITFGVLLDTPNGAQIIYATGEDQWRSWSKSDSYQLPTVNDNGTTSWDFDIQLPF